MDKILDELNGRSFEVNTLEGAQEVLEHFMGDDGNRLNHCKRVVMNMKRLLEYTKLDYATRQKMLMVSTLHDIGYSEIVRISGYHPYDGYLYLRENGWDIGLCNLVLLHSFSRELAQGEYPELYHIFMNAERETDSKLIALISLADFTSSSTGEKCTLEERVEDIEARYGYESAVTKHAKLASRLLYGDATTYKLIKELELGHTKF